MNEDKDCWEPKDGAHKPRARKDGKPVILPDSIGHRPREVWQAAPAVRPEILELTEADGGHPNTVIVHPDTDTTILVAEYQNLKLTIEQLRMDLAESQAHASACERRSEGLEDEQRQTLKAVRKAEKVLGKI